jgi:hypothetical protein
MVYEVCIRYKMYLMYSSAWTCSWYPSLSCYTYKTRIEGYTSNVYNTSIYSKTRNDGCLHKRTPCPTPVRESVANQQH